jgi:hypothetical protein
MRRSSQKVAEINIMALPDFSVGGGGRDSEYVDTLTEGVQGYSVQST